MSEIPAEREIPAWKRYKVTAGAMLILKGYVNLVTLCDHCYRLLAGDDGCIDVRFEGRTACYDCPHCGQTSVRVMQARKAVS